MNSKKIWIAVVALVLAMAILAGIYVMTREDTSDGWKWITVTVVHSDGTEKDFRWLTTETHLGPVLVKKGLVPDERGEFGLFINTVDGETADWSADQSWWALYEGEELAAVGADSLVIHDGDTFRLVYTRG